MSDKHILLVEDEEIWRRLAIAELADLGLQITEVADYGGAIEALKGGPYDLLIFDNTLQHNRNVSVELMQVANLRQRPMPPVIVHSADLPRPIEEQVLSLGGEYVRKSGSSRVLRPVVVRLLKL